ncbi:MAG: alpha/beta fold hydrolase [Chlamydiae bacterium]|nr:alpha/beta fold hydrolase [Chlamydiota bacterium]
MTRIVFVPGNGGCTTKHFWFPGVQSALENQGFEVVAAEFPDPELARSSYWIPFLHDELKVDEKTVLVGHSSGAIAALHYAEKYPIYGSILVGAYHTHLGMDLEKQSGYFDAPWNWEKIRKNQQWTVIFASQDDPWIPIAEPRYLHDQLQCEYHEFYNQGHFMGDYEKRAFTELITTLLDKIH